MKQQRFFSEPDTRRLHDLTVQLRRDTIRMISNAGSGHIGGALGLAECMAVLYGYALEYDTEDLAYKDRDRIVLSNGHTCAIWYAALARTGFIPLEELAGFRRLGSRLQGHPSRKLLPQLVETSTGPLGQGLSVANGIALSQKLQGNDGRVYCILGDGEMQEGQVWEALMTAPQYSLNTMTVFVNYNGLQIDGAVSDVMSIDPLADRLTAFGWNVLTIDGHSIDELIDAFKAPTDRPKAIIGQTLMGKGVSFMEDLAMWHGNCPTPEQAQEALKQVGPADGFEDFIIE